MIFRVIIASKFVFKSPKLELLFSLNEAKAFVKLKLKF